jgi:hypothetical protein
VHRERNAYQPGLRERQPQEAEFSAYLIQRHVIAGVECGAALSERLALLVGLRLAVIWGVGKGGQDGVGQRFESLAGVVKLRDAGMLSTSR